MSEGLTSFLLLQIGTGFKDEDLEQHHSFLKVSNRSDVSVF